MIRPLPPEPTGLPPTCTVIRRDTARVLPVDSAGAVLLLHGWDPERPDEPYWFTVGGAAEPGETLRDAAACELREEVGIVVPPDELVGPIAETTIEFTWAGYPIVQNQAFFAVALDSVDVSFANQDDWELATIDGHQWLFPNELEAAGNAAHPAIPEVMRLAAARVRSTHA